MTSQAFATFLDFVWISEWQKSAKSNDECSFENITETARLQGNCLFSHNNISDVTLCIFSLVIAKLLCLLLPCQQLYECTEYLETMTSQMPLHDHGKLICGLSGESPDSGMRGWWCFVFYMDSSLGHLNRYMAKVLILDRKVHVLKMTVVCVHFLSNHFIRKIKFACSNVWASLIWMQSNWFQWTGSIRPNDLWSLTLWYTLHVCCHVTQVYCTN